MLGIQSISAQQILDSRGVPTLEVEMTLNTGQSARVSVPSGASVGRREAVESRDTTLPVLGGYGVSEAVRRIEEELAPLLYGLDPTQQAVLDQLLIDYDGTENKARIGANVSLALSLALAKVSAAQYHMPLYRYLGALGPYRMPTPFMNVINGGVHAKNILDIQEFMIVPYGFSSFAESLWAGVEIYHTLKALLIEKGMGISVGDEGGFSEGFSSHQQALDMLMDSIIRAGFSPESQVGIALDCASSAFFEEGLYELKGEGLSLDAQDLTAYWYDLIHAYPIMSIEDPMAEYDYDGWKRFMKKVPATGLQVVGDDVFVTQKRWIEEGKKKKVANAVLIKPNQVGTLTETLASIHYAKDHGYACMISHRSGETEDTFIADLAVATGVGQIKAGAPARGERTAKYNQLLRIESSLGANAYFSS